jgi:hypothetical protein
MTTPKKPKTPKAKHPFPKALFAGQNPLPHDDTWCAEGLRQSLADSRESAASHQYELVARYVLDGVYRVKRGTTFEEVK